MPPPATTKDISHRRPDRWQHKKMIPMSVTSFFPLNLTLVYCTVSSSHGETLFSLILKLEAESPIEPAILSTQIALYSLSVLFSAANIQSRHCGT
jgi:hypothetical protein